MQEPSSPSFGSRDLGFGASPTRIPTAQFGGSGFNPADSVGIFVGVSQFSNDADLAEIPYAVDDAVDLAWLFSQQLGLIPPDRIRLHLSGPPKKAETISRLEQLVDYGATRLSAERSKLIKIFEITAMAGARGLQVCALATHGFQTEGTDFFLVEDSLRSQARRTGFSLDELQQDLDNSACKRRLLLVDTCREKLDRASTRRVGGSGLSPSLYSALGKVQGSVVLSAATSGGFAYDDASVGNGVFSHAIIKGLTGGAKPDRDGFIRAGQLAAYVHASVAEWVRVNRPDSTAMPGIQQNMSGDGAKLPLAINPDAFAKAEAEKKAASEEEVQHRARLQKAIGILGRALGWQGFNGVMIDQIKDKLQTGTREEQNELLKRLEKLETQDDEFREDFIAWWTKRVSLGKRDSGSSSGVFVPVNPAPSPSPGGSQPFANPAPPPPQPIVPPPPIPQPVVPPPPPAKPIVFPPPAPVKMPPKPGARPTEGKYVPRPKFTSWWSIAIQFLVVGAMIYGGYVYMGSGSKTPSPEMEDPSSGGATQSESAVAASPGIPSEILEKELSAALALESFKAAGGDTKAPKFFRDAESKLAEGRALMGQAQGGSNATAAFDAAIVAVESGRREVVRVNAAAQIDYLRNQLTEAQVNGAESQFPTEYLEASERLTTRNNSLERGDIASATTGLEQLSADIERITVAALKTRANANLIALHAVLTDLEKQGGKIADPVVFDKLVEFHRLMQAEAGKGTIESLRKANEAYALTTSIADAIKSKIAALRGVSPDGSGARPAAQTFKSFAAGQTPGERRLITIGGGLSIAVRWCPAGDFAMGSPGTEVGRDDDEDQLISRISKGFWMGETEVTQAQWNSVMGSNPSTQIGQTLPVENVSWLDLMGPATPASFFPQGNSFLARLRTITSYEFSLPTEEQWEYACRAGSTTAYHWGNQQERIGEFAWFADNSSQVLQPTGRKKPNPWGLQDMHGNAWEWVRDYFRPYKGQSQPSRTEGVTRGGSAAHSAMWLRSAKRLKQSLNSRTKMVGFRVMLPAGE